MAFIFHTFYSETIYNFYKTMWMLIICLLKKRIMNIVSCITLLVNTFNIISYYYRLFEVGMVKSNGHN